MKNKFSNQPLCSLQNISFAIGPRTLFNNLTLHFYQGEKIAIIGKNGAGKSSLLKIISRYHSPDQGKVFVQPGTLIGYMLQDVFIKYQEQQTIYEYILGNNEETKYILDQFLEPLGLDGNRKLANLSGGRLRRVELARTLYNQPEILLLDEPTNHLDLQAIEWLESYLQKFNGIVLIISHDRQFLENTTNKILFLDRGSHHLHNQGFIGYEEFITQIEQQEIENLRRTERKLEQENHWLTYGVTARRKRNQRRLGELHQLRAKFKEEQQRLNNVKIDFNLPEHINSKASQAVLELNKISCGFNDITPPKVVLKDFSLRILKGERVGVIGRNGAGKTTFIKTLLGVTPLLSGEIKKAPNLKIAYMDQKREQLQLDKSVWDNLADLYGEYIVVNDDKIHLSSYLSKFAFDSSQLHSPAKILSGGEQNRLLMAIALAKPCDLLVLDEPTNDLDLESLEILEEYLTAFKGTVIVISHDRQFIDNLVTKIIIISDGQAEQFVGGYEDYLQILNAQRKEQLFTKKTDNNIKVKNTTKTKLSFKEQRDLETLPAEIDKLTAELTQLEVKLSEPGIYEDYQKMTSLSEQLAKLKLKIEQKEQRLLEVMLLEEEMK